jgi:DNA-binding Lrp family transcriptional regulator
MDTVDRTILHCLQFDFPLTIRPFTSIARSTGISETDVIGRITALKRTGIVRQISAIFDSSRIGYHSVLVAFKVANKKLAAVAESLNENPGVSHNYERTHDFNLWFTVTVPKTRDLKKEVGQMARMAGVRDWLFLPTLKKFKISFQLDMGGQKAIKAATVCKTMVHARIAIPLKISKPFIRELQKDLPLNSRPYRLSAATLGWTESKVLQELKKYIKTGAVRRMAAVLRPQKSGYPANVLTVWAPTIDKKDLLGRVAAGKKQVSHCYERPIVPKWPYSVYTMIHGRTIAECRNVIRDIAKQTGVTAYRELTTVREFKKIRVEYYPLP